MTPTCTPHHPLIVINLCQLYFLHSIKKKSIPIMLLKLFSEKIGCYNITKMIHMKDIFPITYCNLKLKSLKEPTKLSVCPSCICIWPKCVKVDNYCSPIINILYKVAYLMSFCNANSLDPDPARNIVSLDLDMFDTPIVFLNFFITSILKKSQQKTTNYPACKDVR